MINCVDCPVPIKGDHTRTDKDEPIHVRCWKKRIEKTPGFGGWVSFRRVTDSRKMGKTYEECQEINRQDQATHS